jgi:hypothetical protein
MDLHRRCPSGHDHDSNALGKRLPSGLERAIQRGRSASSPVERWKAALLTDAVVGTVTIPPSPSARVRRPACALLVRVGSRARQVVGRWRNGRVTEWTFSPVFQLTVRVVRSNVRILLHDGRVTKIYRR